MQKKTFFVVTMQCVVVFLSFRECGAETFVNFASFERDGKLPYNWYVPSLFPLQISMICLNVEMKGALHSPET